jgi:hypothetical protein
MPFCARVFCRELVSPNLSELLVWLRQYGTPVTICGGSSRDDLLSSFWDEIQLSYDPEEAPLTVRCLRASGPGADDLAREVDDFVADVHELPESPERARVLEHLAATSALVVIEYPPAGVPLAGQQTAEGIVTVFVDRTGGLSQRDGVGFLDDDDDEVVLPMA